MVGAGAAQAEGGASTSSSPSTSSHTRQYMLVTRENGFILLTVAVVTVVWFSTSRVRRSKNERKIRERKKKLLGVGGAASLSSQSSSPSQSRSASASQAGSNEVSRRHSTAPTALGDAYSSPLISAALKLWTGILSLSSDDEVHPDASLEISFERDSHLAEPKLEASHSSSYSHSTLLSPNSAANGSAYISRSRRTSISQHGSKQAVDAHNSLTPSPQLSRVTSNASIASSAAHSAGKISTNKGKGSRNQAPSSLQEARQRQAQHQQQQQQQKLSAATTILPDEERPLVTSQKETREVGVQVDPLPSPPVSPSIVLPSSRSSEVAQSIYGDGSTFVGSALSNDPLTDGSSSDDAASVVSSHFKRMDRHSMTSDNDNDSSRRGSFLDTPTNVNKPGRKARHALKREVARASTPGLAHAVSDKRAIEEAESGRSTATIESVPPANLAEGDPPEQSASTSSIPSREQSVCGRSAKSLSVSTDGEATVSTALTSLNGTTSSTPTSVESSQATRQPKDKSGAAESQVASTAASPVEAKTVSSRADTSSRNSSSTSSSGSFKAQMSISSALHGVFNGPATGSTAPSSYLGSPLIPIAELPHEMRDGVLKSMLTSNGQDDKKAVSDNAAEESDELVFPSLLSPNTSMRPFPSVTAIDSTGSYLSTPPYSNRKASLSNFQSASSRPTHLVSPSASQQLFLQHNEEQHRVLVAYESQRQMQGGILHPDQQQDMMDALHRSIHLPQQQYGRSPRSKTANGAHLYPTANQQEGSGGSGSSGPSIAGSSRAPSPIREHQQLVSQPAYQSMPHPTFDSVHRRASSSADLAVLDRQRQQEAAFLASHGSNMALIQAIQQATQQAQTHGRYMAAHPPAAGFISAQSPHSANMHAALQATNLPGSPAMSNMQHFASPIMHQFPLSPLPNILSPLQLHSQHPSPMTLGSAGASSHVMGMSSPASAAASPMLPLSATLGSPGQALWHDQQAMLSGSPMLRRKQSAPPATMSSLGHDSMGPRARSSKHDSPALGGTRVGAVPTRVQRRRSGSLQTSAEASQHSPTRPGFDVSTTSHASSTGFNSSIGSTRKQRSHSVAKRKDTVSSPSDLRMSSSLVAQIKADRSQAEDPAQLQADAELIASIGTMDLASLSPGELRERTMLVEAALLRRAKELEIARWRIKCHDVEQGSLSIEHQQALTHFAERAERAEARLKLADSKPLSLSGSDRGAGDASPHSPSPRLRGLQPVPELDLSFSGPILHSSPNPEISLSLRPVGTSHNLTPGKLPPYPFDLRKIKQNRRSSQRERRQTAGSAEAKVRSIPNAQSTDVVAMSPSLAGQTSEGGSESEDDVEIVLDASSMSTSALSSFGSAAHSRNASAEATGDGNILGMLSQPMNKQQSIGLGVTLALPPSTDDDLAAVENREDRSSKQHLDSVPAFQLSFEPASPTVQTGPQATEIVGSPHGINNAG